MTSVDGDSPQQLKRSRTGLGTMYPGVSHSTRGWGAFRSADMQAWKTSAEDQPLSTPPLLSDLERFPSATPYTPSGFPSLPMSVAELPTGRHTADWRNDSLHRKQGQSGLSPGSAEQQRSTSAHLQQSPARLEYGPPIVQTSPYVQNQDIPSHSGVQNQTSGGLYDDTTFNAYGPHRSYEDIVADRNAHSASRSLGLQTLASASEQQSYIAQLSRTSATSSSIMPGTIGGLPLGLSPARHLNPMPQAIAAFGQASTGGQPYSAATQLRHHMDAAMPWVSAGGDGARSSYGSTHP